MGPKGSKKLKSARLASTDEQTVICDFCLETFPQVNLPRLCKEKLCNGCFTADMDEKCSQCQDCRDKAHAPLGRGLLPLVQARGSETLTC